MTNAQVGTSCLGRNGSITLDCNWKQCPSSKMLNSRHSILDIGLKTKNVKNSRSFMLRKLRCGTISAMSDEKSDKRLVGGGVLEKEFEFKPSFSEYLKDMETWKSGQLRKQDRSFMCFETRSTTNPSGIIRFSVLNFSYT